MTHYISENCIKCKYTDCVEVCPVDCFHEADLHLVIDPEECIDCGVCIPECPSDAIRSDEEVVFSQEALFFLALNAKLSRVLPRISKKKNPLPEAEKYSTIKDKKIFLDSSVIQGIDIE